VGEPPFDPARKPEPGYVEGYKRAQHELYRRKAALLLQACVAHPGDARVAELMDRRWGLLGWNQDPQDVADEVPDDIDAVLGQPVGADAGVARHAAWWRAHFGTSRLAGDAGAMLAAATPFLDEYPDDERGASLLWLVADDPSADDALRLDVLERLGREYPGAYMASFAPGLARRIRERGLPLQLAFDDVLTGRRIDVADLAGQVVVLDFWSTTCGPCVAELPALQALYAEFHPRGAEFIGISLDLPEEQGGRAALEAFLARHPLPWPQDYQGGGFDSEFSRSWGVGGIPATFVLDRRGRLRSTEARGRLAELLPALLAE